MKGTLTLVVVAAVATWAFLFFPLDKPKAPRAPKKADAAHDATARPSDPVARPAAPAAARDAATGTRAAPGTPTKLAPQANETAVRAPSSAGDVKIIGGAGPSAAQGAHDRAPSDGPPPPFDPDNAPATGELAEGILSPDFKAAEESYVQEPRDGPWAAKHEAKIRDALYKSELREDVVIVHCQSTVCRIHIQPRGGDPFAELMRVPGLAQAAGLDSDTPYSLNGSELIVYARPENAELAPE